MTFLFGRSHNINTLSLLALKMLQKLKINKLRIACTVRIISFMIKLQVYYVVKNNFRQEKGEREHKNEQTLGLQLRSSVSTLDIESP